MPRIGVCHLGSVYVVGTTGEEGGYSVEVKVSNLAIFSPVEVLVESGTEMLSEGSDESALVDEVGVPLISTFLGGLPGEKWLASSLEELLTSVCSFSIWDPGSR